MLVISYVVYMCVLDAPYIHNKYMYSVGDIFVPGTYMVILCEVDDVVGCV